MSEPAILWGPGIDPIAASTTAVFTTRLVDAAGNPIPPANFTTLTLKIFDTVTGAQMLAATNILNTGRGQLSTDSAGNTILTVTLLTTDTAPFNPKNAFEIRSLVYDWTFNSGTGVGHHQADFQITIPLEP